MRFVSLTAVTLLVMSFCGCAVDQRIGLTYTPFLNAAGGRGAVEIERPDIVSIQKNNKGQFIIGTVINSLGVRIADTVTNDSPGDWLALALKTELERAGYHVVLVEDLQGKSAKALKPSVEKIWVDHVKNFLTIGAESEFSFNVKVMKYGRVVDVIHVREEASPRAFYGGTARQKEQALQMAIQASMRQAVPKIIRSLE